MDTEKPLVLIVDDSPANIHVLANTLGDSYRIKVATDGNTALEIVEQPDTPDLVLLDIMMPGIDGYEVCRRLKANDLLKEIPVIFITSLGKDEDEGAGLELGAVDYIVKPFNPSIVALRVKNHLELKKQRDMLQKYASELQDALNKVRLLSGLLPICSSCKKIREDSGYWKQLETYIKEHSEAEFTHCICPDCMKRLYPWYHELSEGEEKHTP